VSVADFLELIVENPRFSANLSYIKKIPRQEAVHAIPRNPLPPLVSGYLEKEDLMLYSHQAAAFDSVAECRDTILCTPTASGKTLSFLLPLLAIRASDPDATALAIYPAKALTRDQLAAIRHLEKKTGIQLNASVYDGDTPRHDRAAIRSKSGLILTNPYEIHHILPWHHQWSTFFSHLKYIIIDEAHQYRGVFGSHMALLIRRLLRIAAHYGSHPRFFLSSATLANPDTFAHELTGRHFEVISRSGAPTGVKYFVLYNPYMTGLTERSVYTESATLLASLIEADLQTLCFTGSRRMTEIVATWAGERLSEGTGGGLSLSCRSKIAAYRAGYLPEERREIEGRLKNGTLKGIVSTNALELGIDIGTLDAVVITGYPGTMMSTWQQTGRAGRGGSPSLAVLISFQNPLDQYFMDHPEDFFSRPHEHAIITTKNPYILSGQIMCAAAELPLDPDRDQQWFGEGMAGFLPALADAQVLARTNRGYVYSGRKRAVELVSLSGTGDTWTIEVKGRVLETVDTGQATREAHPGAVIIHQGDKYLVNRWDQERHRILAEAADVEYYTRPNQQTVVTIIHDTSSRVVPGGVLHFGEVSISEHCSGYRKIIRQTTIATEQLDLPPITYSTMAVWIVCGPEIIDDLAKENLDLPGSLHGAEHALIAMTPFFVLCDRWDLGGLSTALDPQTGSATIYMYDGYEGGVGLAERAFGLFGDICHIASDLVRDCRCAAGCPACIHSPKCGNDNQPLDKAGTALILRSLAAPQTQEPFR
jgi:DEAD/DEAH box helicase domain-containing protein